MIATAFLLYQLVKGAQQYNQTTTARNFEMPDEHDELSKSDVQREVNSMLNKALSQMIDQLDARQLIVTILEDEKFSSIILDKTNELVLSTTFNQQALFSQITDDCAKIFDSLSNDDKLAIVGISPSEIDQFKSDLLQLIVNPVNSTATSLNRQEHLSHFTKLKYLKDQLFNLVNTEYDKIFQCFVSSVNNDLFAYKILFQFLTSQQFMMSLYKSQLSE